MSGWLQFRSPQWKNDDDKTQKNENSSNQSALIDSVLNHVKENVTLGQIDVTSLACQKARFVISPGIESPDRTIQYHQPPNFDNSSHSHEPSDFFSPEASQNTKSQILINNFQVNETPIMATTWQLNECTDEFSSGHNQHILRNQLTECNLSVSASLDSAGPSRPQAHENNINTLSNEPQGEKVKDSNATDEELTDNPSCEKKSLRWKPHDEWEFNEISARHSHGNGSNSMINSDDSSSLNFQEFRLQDDHRSKATLDNCDGQNSYDGEEERSLEQEVNDDSSTHSCPYHKLDGLLSQSDGTPEDLSVLSRSNLKRLKSPLLSPQKDELSVSCNETGKSFLINNSCISLERESTSPPRPEDSYLNQLYLKKKTVLNTESNFSGRQVDGYTAGHEHEGCSNNNNGCDSEYLKSDYFQHVQGNPIYDQPKAVFSLNPGEKANENRPSNNQDDAFEEDECSTVCDNRSFSVRAAQIFTKENSMAENLAERSDFQEPTTLQNDKILYSSQSPNDQSFYSESNSSEAEISKYFKSAEKKRTGSSHRNPVDSFDTHLLTTPGTSLLQVCGRNEVDFDHDQKFNFQAQPSIPCSKDVHNETFAATTDPSVNSDVFSGLDLATKTGNKLNQACSLDLVMEHSDKKMLNIYARAASAPPFNKSPSFISLDSPKLASQNYSQIQSKTSKKSFSQSPIFDKSASMVPEQQNALHTTLSSNFLISKRVANSPWQASVVKTPSKLQNSYIPSSPSNTTISEGVLQAASPGSSFAKASTGRSVLLRSQRSDLSQRLNEQQLRHVVKETQSAPKHLELAASSEPKIQEEFANQFLSSPESASNPKLCTSGEAKIFTSHNQSNSLFSHVMNGPSMSRLQDQSLALLTPNQSYGLDFSSPVQVKDWSINHPPGHPRWITKADSGSETNVYLNSQAPYKLNDNRDETRNKVPVHIWNPSDESHISYWDERLLEDSPVKHRQPDGVHVIPETSSQASVVTTSQANLSGQFFAPKAGDLNLKSHHNVQRGSEPSAYPIVIHEGFGAEGAQSHPFMSQSSNVTQSHPPKKSFTDLVLSDSDHADDASTGFIEIKSKLISSSIQANKPSVHFDASPHSTHNHIAINKNSSSNQPILPSRASSFDTQPQHTIQPKQVLIPYLPVVDTAPTKNQLGIAMDTESQHFDVEDVSFAQSSEQEPSPFEMAEDEQTMFFSPSASFRDFPQTLSRESLDKVRKRPQIACRALEDERRFSSLVQDRDDSQLCLKADAQIRYRILISIAENFKQDLSVKNEIIRLLELDNNQLKQNYEVTKAKICSMKQKVKAAAEDQRRQRQWQAEKIELIVNKLTLDIENVSSAKDPNRSDESLDPAQIQKFNQSLATTKEALVTLQQVVNNYGTTNSELETQNSKQTLKIEEYEKQIFELKQQLTDSKEKVRENVLRAGNLLSTVSFTNELKSETRSINHDAEEPQCDWKSKAHSLEAALSKTERARREEVLNLRHRIGEINSRNQKAIKQLESNIQMLEGEAATRMESLTELRNQNLRLKDELNQKSKKIIAAEEEFLKAMDEQSKLKMELKKLEEGYQKQEKLIKSKENSDHLKKSEERLEKRSSDELKDLRSKICIECKSKNDRVIVLEGELKRLNQKIEEARVDSANLEVKATQARKNVKELREDILGLNIALEAKQQEIAYLKREKLARKAASDPRSLNLGDSKPIISKSTARKILQQSSSRYDFEKSSKVDDQFSLGVNIKTSDMSRKMLSQITNLQRDDSIEKLDVNRNQALNKSTKNTKALDKSTKKTQALDTSVRTKTTKAKLGASEYSILSENTIINNNDLKPTSTIATKERMNRMVPSFISVSSNEGSVSNNRRFSVVNHSSSSRS